MYPKGQLRMEGMQAEANGDVCWTLGSAEWRSRQRTRQGERPAEMVCCQPKWILTTWKVCMVGRNAASYLHLSALTLSDQKNSKKSPSFLRTKMLPLCVEQQGGDRLTKMCSLCVSLPWLYAGKGFPNLSLPISIHWCLWFKRPK